MAAQNKRPLDLLPSRQRLNVARTGYAGRGVPTGDMEEANKSVCIDSKLIQHKTALWLCLSIRSGQDTCPHVGVTVMSFALSDLMLVCGCLRN